MSSKNPSSGLTLVILIVILGVVSLFDIVLFFAFIAVLGYYLNRTEKRLMVLEAASAAHTPQPAKKPGQE